MIDPARYPLPVQILALTKYSGVRPRLFELLFQRFSDMTSLLNASVSSLSAVPGVTKAQAEKIARASTHLERANAYYTSLLERQISISTRFDSSFGHRLVELNDPPSLLYVRGKLPDPDRKAVTLVGASGATAEGIAWSTSLARAFAAEGIDIISSLDVGNDAAVHLGCRAAQGQSFAVVDSGFNAIAAVEQSVLASDIIQSGGLISEYPPETPTSPENLSASNRLLAGLGQAVVVSELYLNSTRVHDLLECCGLVGKLALVTIDPVNGPLADKESLNFAVKHGAVVLHGPNQIADIIKSLV